MHIHLSSIELQELPNISSINRPNFFCVIQVLGDDKIQKTSICFDTFSPQWTDDFYFETLALQNVKLSILVKYEDKIGTDFPIAITKIQLDEFQMDQECIKTYDMNPIDEEEKVGKMTIKLTKSINKPTFNTNFTFDKKLLNDKLFHFYKDQPILTPPTEGPPISPPPLPTIPPGITLRKPPPNPSQKKKKKEDNENPSNEHSNDGQDQQPKKRGRKKKNSEENPQNEIHPPKSSINPSQYDPTQSNPIYGTFSQLPNGHEMPLPNQPLADNALLNQPFRIPASLYPQYQCPYPNYPPTGPYQQPFNSPGQQTFPPNQINPNQPIPPFQQPMRYPPIFMNRQCFLPPQSPNQKK